MDIRKFNRITACLISVLIFFGAISITAFASPETIAVDAESTKTELITLKAPETENLSTTNKCLPISAEAPCGAVVTVYKYNAASDTYNKVYTGEEPVEATVGAKMLFATQAELSLGSNKFLLRSAIDDENYQIVKFEVKLLNEGFMDKIKSIAGMIFN